MHKGQLSRDRAHGGRSAGIASRKLCAASRIGNACNVNHRVGAINQRGERRWRFQRAGDPGYAMPGRLRFSRQCAHRMTTRNSLRQGVLANKPGAASDCKRQRHDLLLRGTAASC